MLSKKTKGYFIKSLKAASFLRCLPYKWEPRRQCVLTTTSRGHLTIWAGCFLAELIFEIFIFYRLIQASVWQQTTPVMLINLRYKVIAYILPVLFQITTVMRWEQFPIFVNSYVRFYGYLQAKYKRQDGTPKIVNGCEVVLPYIFYLGIAIPTLQSIVVVTRPEDPTLFSSLLENPRKASMLIRIPIAAYHAYICYAFCFKMQVFTFGMLGYISPATLIISELRPEGPSSVMTEHSRRPEEFLHIYRGMQYVQRMFNQVVAKFELACIKTVLIGATVLGIYGCVRLDDTRRVLPLAIVATASMITLKATYEAMGRVYESSLELLVTWRGILGRNRVNLRMWRSLWPLKTRIGIFYIVEKTIVLVIGGIVIEQTIGVLLAF